MMNIKENIENLHPAYFAMVMSTGIVSIAFKELGFGFIFLTLFFINLITYVILFPMLIARIIFFSGKFLKDLKNPMRSVGFFTFVVGTNTLGVQFFLLGFVDIAKVLWLIGLFSWLLCIYAIYLYFIVISAKTIENTISGATLLTTVSTQSVAVLGSLLAIHFEIYSHLVIFLSWMFWALGFVLYIIVIVFVTYRLLFRVMEPKDWTGPYWICMGAAAITTLAGSNVVMNMKIYPALDTLRTATLALVFLCWAIGTWWIPIQIVMDIWKFNKINIDNKAPGWIKTFPWLRLGFGGKKYHFYEPPSWGRVFPMGMYTACTIALSRASNFEFLFSIPMYWGWLALFVWALTFIGTMRAVLK